MRHDRVAQNRRFVIHADRKVYDYGAPVYAQVEILDMQLLAGLGDRLELVISEPSAISRQPSANMQDQSAIRNPQSAIPFAAHRLGPDSNVYEGTVIPARAGAFLIGPGRELNPSRDLNPSRPPQADEGADVPPRGAERTASVSIRVEPPRLEMRRIEADHDVLERIARASGGRVLELDQLEAEFAAIEDRSVRIPDDLAEPLWDSKLVLMIFGLMISIEWVMRKAFGLL